MKKSLILFLSLLVMACLLACGKSEVAENENEISEDAVMEAQETPAAAKAEISEITAPVFVYSDEMFTLHYIGTDTEYFPSLVFNVANKTEQDIGFYFETIAVNGKTESPAFIVEVMAGTEAEYWCDVSTIDGLETLTANICITDSEGYTIKECSIKDAPLK